MKSHEEPKKGFPEQQQPNQPGTETEMNPTPISTPKAGHSGKLQDKVAVITGGDSGIGKAVALLFASEGADVVIVYFNEHEDAAATEKEIKEIGGKAILIPGDLSNPEFCKEVIEQTITSFGKIDILINNAAVQFPQEDPVNITQDQLELTFKINFFAPFYMSQAALKHMKAGSVIINSSSVTAFRGSNHLVDYASTKGALIAFTRSLSLALQERKIRVNAVAPGPIWTPLIPASFPADHVASFGTDVPMGRAGQPNEVAPAYLFLASEDGSYFTGQTLHPNGGEIINT